MKVFIFLFLSVLSADSLHCKVDNIFNLSENCTVVSGDIIIDSSMNLTFLELSEKLSTVKQVYGRVILMETKFENFSFLSSLQSIYYEPKTEFKTSYMQNCLRIENNPNLRELGMPNLVNFTLESIPTDWQFYATYIMENPKLCIEEKQVRNWLSSERVRVPPMIYCGIKVIEKTSNFIKYSIKNGTKVYCSVMDTKYPFHGLVPLGCQIMEIGIWMKDNYNRTELDHLAIAIQSLEIIYGSIAFRNTTVNLLNFESLEMIYNMHFDDPEFYGGRGTQALLLVDNKELIDAEFPRLSITHHFGKDPFVVISKNTQLRESEKSCNMLRKLYLTDIQYKYCGMFSHLPILNGVWPTGWRAVEMIICISVNIGWITYFTYYFLKIRKGATKYQLLIIAHYFFIAAETLVFVLNVQFLDDKKQVWRLGFMFLATNNDEYFSWLLKTIHMTRISLLTACSLYRCFILRLEERLRTGIIACILGFLVFVFIEMYTGSELEWLSFVIIVISMFYLHWKLRSEDHVSNLSDLKAYQKKLTIVLSEHALVSFIFTSFPYAVLDDIFSAEIARDRHIFVYEKSNFCIRWHYVSFAIILRCSMTEIMRRIDLRKKKTSVIRTNSVVPIG